MLIDLHGHVNKMGTFLYGNALKGMQQIENMLFAKLLTLNSVNFDFADCNFTESNMVVKDRIDGMSREGSSRVAIYKETSIPNCYTIETSFQGSKKANFLAPKFNKLKKAIESELPITNPNSKIYDGKPAVYNPEIWEDMGRAICNSLLDQFDENPVSRLPNSNFKSIEGIKNELAQHLNIHVTIPYKIKRTTIYCPTATSEGKKKSIAGNPLPNTTKQQSKEIEASTLKKIKEVRKEYVSTATSKRKPLIPREKSTDIPALTENDEEEKHKITTQTNGLLKSKKTAIIEERRKEESPKPKRKEHKLNSVIFPAIEGMNTAIKQIPENIQKKPRQAIRHIKVRIASKSSEIKKGTKPGKNHKDKKVDHQRKDSKRGKHYKSDK